MVLPPALRDHHVEIAGLLVVSEDPGAEVKRLRERYGFTQEWLARLLDMRRESLSRIESGRVNISMPFLQNFTRIMTLARGVREHLASLEGRGGIHADDHLRGAAGSSRSGGIDDQYLEMLAHGLQLDRRTSEEIILASIVAYDKKRRAALKELRGRPDPQWQEARPMRSAETPDAWRRLPAAKAVVATLHDRESDARDAGRAAALADGRERARDDEA